MVVCGRDLVIYLAAREHVSLRAMDSFRIAMHVPD
jgi:hypothetical protein